MPTATRLLQNCNRENRYGSHFYENVSRDMRHVLGLKRGLSPTTIKYTHYFYCLYNQVLGNRQGVVDESGPANRQHGVDEFKMLLMIPWSHYTRIIDKVKGDARKGLFFCEKVYGAQKRLRRV